MKQSKQEQSSQDIKVGDSKAVKGKSRFFDTHSIAVMGILTAISYLLYMFVKFPLPFIFPAFLDIQISELPALLGAFALGPVQGALIVIVKCVLKMPFSSTACVGELADIIIGLAFVLPASLIYHHRKCKKTAIVSLVIGSITAVIVALLANVLMLIPFYSEAYGIDALVGMMKGLYPDITADTLMGYYLPLAVLPFNLLRTTLCAVIGYLTYKPLSRILHWEHKEKLT